MMEVLSSDQLFELHSEMMVYDEVADKELLSTDMSYQTN